MNIDLDRCRRGMSQLAISGSPRAGEIADAIAQIQQNPIDAMRTRYIGVKNYASFGDQREDHEYGFGPKHGYIVFRIGRVKLPAVRALDHDAIYLLEAYRDCAGLNLEPIRGHGSRTLFLCEVIREIDNAEGQLAALNRFIQTLTVESHEKDTP